MRLFAMWLLDLNDFAERFLCYSTNLGVWCERFQMFLNTLNSVLLVPHSTINPNYQLHKVISKYIALYTNQSSQRYHPNAVKI